MTGFQMVFLVYGLHALFWSPFIIRRQMDSRSGGVKIVLEAHQGKGASTVVLLHGVGISVSYIGIAIGLFGGVLWPLPMAVRLLGVPIVLVTTWMIVLVMRVFRSWRLKAALSRDHQLCTDGPFRIVRHPIYTGILLLAVASFLLVPNAFTAVGIVTTFVAGDLRASTEESLLRRAFGDRYAAYSAKKKRFIPFVY
ncbi:farnesyl cysteine carboxyl-methyltransferase [Planctomycetota bacterium]|nr:farnesyl cysteine carboxyl-methyltransferase [Planctomycetota bacterium]